MSRLASLLPDTVLTYAAFDAAVEPVAGLLRGAHLSGGDGRRRARPAADQARRDGQDDASDAAMRVTTEAAQVLGGNGYLKDYPAERMMRDAKVLQIYEGAKEIQQLVIARVLAEEAQGREPLWPECMPEEATSVASEQTVGTLA